MELSSDKAVLSMNPVNTSYLLLENIEKRIRESQGLVRRAVDVAESIQAKKKIDESESSELLVITSSLKRNSAATFNELIKIRKELDKEAGLNDLRKSLRIAMNQYQVSVEELIHSIEEDYIIQSFFG